MFVYTLFCEAELMHSVSVLYLVFNNSVFEKIKTNDNKFRELELLTKTFFFFN